MARIRHEGYRLEAGAFSRPDDGSALEPTRLHALVQSLTEGVIVADPSGCILDMNEEACRLLHLLPDGAVATAAEAFSRFEIRDASGAVVPASASPLQRALDGERFQDFVAEVRDVGMGESGLISFSGGPIRDESGRVTSALLAMRDVAEQVRGQRERDRLLEQMAAVSAVSEAAMSTLDLDRLLGRVLDVLMHVMIADAAVIMLRTDDVLRPAKWFGLDQVVAPPTLAVGEGFAGGVAASGRTTHVPDCRLAEGIANGECSDRIVSLLGASLGRAGQSIGVVHVGWKSSHPYSADEAHVLELLADRTGLAIENAMLYSAAEESRRLGDALTHIDSVIHSTLDFDDVVRMVTEQAAAGMGVDACAVGMYRSDGEWCIQYAHGLPHAEEPPLLGESAVPSLRELRTSAKPVMTGGSGRHGGQDPWLEQHGIAGALAVPLVSRDRVIGALGFYLRDPQRSFSPAQRDFANKLAAALSLALENARLYEREHHIAETLQESLLALPDHVNEFRLAHAYRSAAEAARVGGDLYDAFETYDGRVCLVVGDISGKGLEAAVLSSLVRNTTRAYAMERGVTPHEVLERVNAAVYAQTETEIFVTLFIALIEPFDGSMVYCNAAHPSPMLRRRDGSVVELPGNSPLLGAFGSVPFCSANATVEDGDVLVLYTDGLIEARRGKEMFGEGRVARVLAEQRGDIDAIVRALIEEVGAFSYDGLKDDTAILVAERSLDARTRRQRQQRLRLPQD